MGLAILIIGLVVLLGSHIFVTFRESRAALIGALRQRLPRAFFAGRRSSDWF